MNNEDATFLNELRRDVREWRNIILTELKERYAEDIKIMTRISELEIRLAQIDKSLDGLELRLTNHLEEHEREERQSFKTATEGKKGKFTIYAALIASLVAIIPDIIEYIKYWFK